jgi:hypothetical protein
MIPIKPPNMGVARIRCLASQLVKLWITAEKLWITRVNWGQPTLKCLIRAVRLPPYLGACFESTTISFSLMWDGQFVLLSPHPLPKQAVDSPKTVECQRYVHRLAASNIWGLKRLPARFSTYPQALLRLLIYRDIPLFYSYTGI